MRALSNALLASLACACLLTCAASPTSFAQKKRSATGKAATAKASTATPKASTPKAAATQKTKAATTAKASTVAPKTPNSQKAPNSQRTSSAQKAPNAQQRSSAPSSAKVITVQTEPNAVVWLDELRRGVTDEAGQLVVKNVAAGRRTLRVRATGFQERTLVLLPTQRGRVEVKLTRTTDEAELLFQQAEDAREGVAPPAGVERKDAAELYRAAIALRPRFPAAHVGLARVLAARDDYDAALEEIKQARRARPVYPEASAVEGRILRSAADPNAAIESYRRALREARGFQPEALAGLGIVYEEQGNYEEAADAFRKAVAQLQDTEPALYELLGRVYERLEKYREAVAAYEKYLELAPEGKLAPAIRSIIDQLREQAAGQQTTPNQ